MPLCTFAKGADIVLLGLVGLSIRHFVDNHVTRRLIHSVIGCLYCIDALTANYPRPLLPGDCPG